jgi:hypothetical protein
MGAWRSAQAPSQSTEEDIVPTFTVQGHKLRSASTRRFLVVKVKEDAWGVFNVETDNAHGYAYERLAVERGFRQIFKTEAEAVAAARPGQIVKPWSKAGAEVVKRSDSYETARRHALSFGGAVVLDTSTGEVL